jgi:hypothetical protein
VRVPVVENSDLRIPTEFLLHPVQLGLKPAEVVLILQVSRLPLKPGDDLPAPTLAQLSKLMGLSRTTIGFWKSSLERKGYLLSRKKIAEDGRVEAAYWDLSPLWKAVATLAAPTKA